jgi:hypothetical protein
MRPHVRIRAGIERYAGKAYRDHKFRFKQKYYSGPGGDERPDIADMPPPGVEADDWASCVTYYSSPDVATRAKINKDNREKQVIVGHGGRTSLAQYRHKFVSCFNL